MMRTKARRLSKRLASVLMAGVLAAGMIGVTAFAEDGAQQATTPGVTENSNTVKLTKKVLTDGNTPAPNATFGYTISTGSAGTYDDNVVYQGVGSPTVGNTEFKATEAAADVSASYVKETTIDFSSVTFNRAGVYHYVVTENDFETAGAYEGIKKDNTSYDVYVYVYAEDGSLKIKNVVSTFTKDGAATKADIIFKNNYGKDTTNPDPDPDPNPDPDPDDSTHDITITKVIAGNMAKLDDTFKVDVTVNGAANEKYLVEVGDTKSLMTSGTAQTFDVTNNTTIKVHGLTNSDQVTIKEKDNSDGYVATYSSKVGETTKNDYTAAAGISGLEVTADGSTATITNTKNTSTPTGIILTYAPYILMIALAGAMAFFFLRRRNEEI